MSHENQNIEEPEQVDQAAYDAPHSAESATDQELEVNRRQQEEREKQKDDSPPAETN